MPKPTIAEVKPAQKPTLPKEFLAFSIIQEGNLYRVQRAQIQNGRVVDFSRSDSDLQGIIMSILEVEILEHVIKKV